jgi:Cu-Zn family superoxide dismutase
LILFATLAACGTDDPVEADANITGTSSTTTQGTAAFSAVDGKTTVVVSLTNTPSGTHGVHIHETGDCSAADGTSAGGHWNPGGHEHGEWGGTEHHLGDIGNVVVDATGAGTLSLSTEMWTIGDGSATDIVGKAVIVHANADDYTPPAGNAGARIGCGVIAMP